VDSTQDEEDDEGQDKDEDAVQVKEGDETKKNSFANHMRNQMQT
jgi:hypothetical protein